MSILKRRAISFYIDLLCIIFIAGIIQLSIKSFSSNYLLPYLSQSGEAVFYKYQALLFNPIFLLTIFNYFFISLYLSGGMTLGMTMMNLKTKSNNGNDELTLNQSFIRAATYTFSIILAYLPFLINLFTKNKKGLADFLSLSTTQLCVVKQDTIYLSQDIKNLSNNKLQLVSTMTNPTKDDSHLYKIKVNQS